MLEDYSLFQHPDRRSILTSNLANKSDQIFKNSQCLFLGHSEQVNQEMDNMFQPFLDGLKTI